MQKGVIKGKARRGIFPRKSKESGRTVWGNRVHLR